MKRAVEPFEKIHKAVGDRMQIMVEFQIKRIARVFGGLPADLVRGSDPHELGQRPAR
jgi:hypothetical protein